jgi:hypothetical protein
MVAHYPFLFVLASGAINVPSAFALLQRDSDRQRQHVFLERAVDPWWDGKSVQGTEEFRKDYVHDRDDLNAMKRFEAENAVNTAMHQLQDEQRKLKDMEGTHQQNDNKIEDEGQDMKKETNEAEKHESTAKQAEANKQQHDRVAQNREEAVAENKACAEALTKAEQDLANAKQELAKARAAGNSSEEAPSDSGTDWFETESKQIDKDCEQKHALLKNIKQAQAVVDEKKVCADKLKQSEEDLAKAQEARTTAEAEAAAAEKSALKEKQDVTQQSGDLDNAKAAGEESAAGVSAQEARVERAQAKLEEAKKELAAYSAACTSHPMAVAAIAALVVVLAMSQ